MINQSSRAKRSVPFADEQFVWSVSRSPGDYRRSPKVGLLDRQTQSVSYRTE